jgi:preprotein translocase subunit YajC
MAGNILTSIILIALGALLIYFIVKRTQDKKKENFEERDN